MNFLELGQRLTIECGAGNVQLTTMQNQKGEALRFVNWVSQAWNELQTVFDCWEWMRSSSLLGAGVSFVADPGQAVVPLGTGPGQIGLDPKDFGGKWVEDSFRNYVTSFGFRSEIFLESISYDWWRDAYMYGANRAVQTRPVVIAVGPGKEICLGPPSNGLYTTTGDYYRSPAIMAQDTDIPAGLPTQYHMAIIYKGMEYYGAYEAATEVVARGEEGYGNQLFELTRRYGPRVKMGGPLA